MNLVVDIGNTRTKYAVFEDNLFVESGTGVPELYEKALCWRKRGEEVNVIMASTGRYRQVKSLSKRYLQLFFVKA